MIFARSSKLSLCIVSKTHVVHLWENLAYQRSGDGFYVRAPRDKPVSGLSLNSFSVFQFLLEFHSVTSHLATRGLHCCYLNDETYTEKPS